MNRGGNQVLVYYRKKNEKITDALQTRGLSKEAAIITAIVRDEQLYGNKAEESFFSPIQSSSGKAFKASTQRNQAGGCRKHSQVACEKASTFVIFFTQHC